MDHIRFTMRLNSPAIFLFTICCFAACNRQEESPAANRSHPFFEDITVQSGINFVHNPAVEGHYFMPESIGSGGAFLDYDGDGDLDIYLLNGAYRDKKKTGMADPLNRLFRQEADGTFTDVTAISGLGHGGYAMGVAVGDSDNDGDVDLYITNYGADVYFRNNGDGTFSEIAGSSGIDNTAWGSSVIFCDYDLDGFLDIYVANYLDYDPGVHCTDRGGQPDYCGPGGFAGVADKLYRNNGDGSFSDASVQAGISALPARSLGIVSSDLNSDGLPDFYVANDGEANHLWINRGNGIFEDRALLMGAATNQFAQPEAGMGIAIGDMDNDSDPDLFVTHLRGESNTLYRNLGQPGFQDYTSQAALAAVSTPYTSFGTGFIDYDNDGDLDLALVNGRVTRGPLLKETDTPGHWDYYSEPNMLFENNGAGLFSNVSSSEPDYCGEIENSRGLAFGDIDNDGDVDMLVMNEGGPARLYRNESERKGNWLMVRVVDPELNRDAIGAAIVIAVEKRLFRRSASPGYSFLSSSDMRVHFGLGTAGKVDKIEVYWPGGITEYFPGAAANQSITLRKGEGQFRRN